MESFITLPCFPYHAEHIENITELKHFASNFAWAYKKLGIPEEDICDRFICLCTEIMDEKFNFETQSEIQLAKIIQTLPKGRHNCQTYSLKYYVQKEKYVFDSFCMACPIGNPENHDIFLKEMELLASAVRKSSDERISMLNTHMSSFCSYVYFNEIINRMIRLPITLKLPLEIAKILCEKDCPSYDEDGIASIKAYICVALSNEIWKKMLLTGHEKEIPANSGAVEACISEWLDKYLIQPEVRDQQESAPLAAEDHSAKENSCNDDIEQEKDLQVFDTTNIQAESSCVEEDSCHSERANSDNGDSCHSKQTCNDNQKAGVHKDDENRGSNLTQEDHFTENAKITIDSSLGQKENLTGSLMSNKRFQIPFDCNDNSVESLSKNVIIHHEMTIAALQTGVDLSIPSKEILQEMSNLAAKVRKDHCMAAEVVYLKDLERYILLIWNAATRRYNFIPLIDKKDGHLIKIPDAVVELLSSQAVTLICFQPYLLCGLLGLYQEWTGPKSVHAIYTRYRVYMEKEPGCSSAMEQIIDSYIDERYCLDSEIVSNIRKYRELFGNHSYLLSVMPLYTYIRKRQDIYAQKMSLIHIVSNQHHKDLMYGHSYLSAGIYPKMQGAAFKLLANGQFIFYREVEPSASYFPGCIMEFTFQNKDNDGNEITISENRKNNRKAIRLMLCQLARRSEAFYRNGLKILYYDDYKIIFFVTPKYKAIHKTDIIQAFMHETYRYRIPSNKLKATFWSTGTDIAESID